MFFSSIPMKIAKNLKNNGYVTQCQFSVSTNNNRKLYLFIYLFIYLRQASRIGYNCNFKLNVITFASVRSKISMYRTLTELAFKIVSLRFVYPPPPLPPPDVVCPPSPPPSNTLQYITISFCLLPVILKSITTQHGIYFRSSSSQKDMQEVEM